MSSDFDREGVALLAAVRGQPVELGDVGANFDLHEGESGSANHKLGSNPAVGLDALRRGDRRTAEDVARWAEFYVGQPLHENEAMTPSVAYRPRIAYGTYALAVLAKRLGNEALTSALLARCRADVAWIAAGAFTGPARLVDESEPSGAKEIVGSGQIAPLRGSGGAVPYFAQAGKRGWYWVNGSWLGLNDQGLGVMVAQAAGLPYSGSAFQAQDELFSALRIAAPALPMWGFDASDVELLRSYLRDPRDVSLARMVARWIDGARKPRLPVKVIHRASGAVEFAMLSIDGSSTGAKAVEVVMPDGTRRMGSSDTGLRGGEADRSKNIQAQSVEMLPDVWRCRWKSGAGVVVDVRRPDPSDAVIWTLETDGNQAFAFATGSQPVPQPPTPTPGPAPQPPKPHRKRSIFAKIADLLKKLF